MTDPTARNVVPDEIASLLQQRTTLREWIESVEDRREEVRPDVFRRVKDDYRQRLAGVEESLATHRSDLARSLDEREVVVGELEEQREVRAAELEEVELRHAVGEFDEDTWRERKAEHEEILSDLEERLRGERAAAEELREVLEELEDLGAEPVAVASGSTPGGSSGAEQREAADSGMVSYDLTASTERSRAGRDEPDATAPEPSGTDAEPVDRQAREPSLAGGGAPDAGDADDGAPAEAARAEEPGTEEPAREQREPDSTAAPSGEASADRERPPAERPEEEGGSPAADAGAGDADSDEVTSKEKEDALDFLENLSLEGVDFDTLDLDAEEEDEG